MDELEFSQGQYASFLVRLWRKAGPPAGDDCANWQGEVEHIQSGRRWTFASISEMVALLCQPLHAGESLGQAIQ